MAANKFATMLHRNTNNITLILVYAVLEWILIILLLLNSLFSYLIVKFADYFGLKKPCLWCSRLDHIFEPSKTNNSHRDLICEAHAMEISKLGYCINHRKLAESREMCEDCSSSNSGNDCAEWSKKFAFFPWMKQIGMIKDGGDENDIDKVVEDKKEEENLKCSCCGVDVNTRFYPPYILINPSWGVLDYAQKLDFIEEEDEEEEEGNIDDQTYEVDHSDHSRSEFVADHHEDYEQGSEENRGAETVFAVDEGSEERREDEEEVIENVSLFETNFLCREFAADVDEETNKVLEKAQEEEEQEEKPRNEDNLEISMEDKSKVRENILKDTPVHRHLEFFIGQEDCTLIPIELVESATNENRNRQNYKAEDEVSSRNQDVILDFDMDAKTQAEQVTETWHSSGVTFELLSSNKSVGDTKLEEVVESERRSSFAFHAEEIDWETRQLQKLSVTRATRTHSGDNDEGQAMAAGECGLDVHQGYEDDIHMQSDEVDGEISIGTEIPDQEPIDEIESQEIHNEQHELSTRSINLHIDDDQDFERVERELVEIKISSIEINQKEVNNHSAFCSELSDIEEEKVPDTPNSIDSLHQLHKKLLLLERRESGAEESLDGSVVSDIEGGDGIPAVEKLKSVLKAERKALNALYAELEEERSASAVAASQTMAMINRLQEEKAAMQMEALQYQRMMEEQSEYDQEALQLLNELMIKREKEKQELEKELEMYRKRIQEYEAKERMMVKRVKDGSTRSLTSSVSCSNAEDSDGLSIDLNNEAKEEESGRGHEEIGNQNTPADAVLYLEESLASFEEERLSILDQLRMLEEKLFTLSDGEENQHFEDIKSIDHLYKENGNGYHHEDLDANGVVTNGHSKEMNGKHHHQDRRIMGTKAKRLLPFFDATEAEAEDGVLNGNGEAFDYISMQTPSVIEFEQDYGKRLAVEEEVDHVYERLQALEADREFLKHCISSLRKGDKGLYLLQEILQHLRDLRSVEHRVRSVGDNTL